MQCNCTVPGPVEPVTTECNQKVTYLSKNKSFGEVNVRLCFARRVQTKRNIRNPLCQDVFFKNKKTKNKNYIDIKLPSVHTF